MARQPNRFRKVGIGLVETDENRFSAGLDLLAQRTCSIEPESHLTEWLCDDVTVFRMIKSHRNVGDMALKADGTQIGGQINIQARMLRRQPRQLADQETLR